MQKRYCSCGQKVFVSFSFSTATWRVLFYGEERGFGRFSQTQVCPNCGQPLHIDRVR